MQVAVQGVEGGGAGGGGVLCMWFSSQNASFRCGVTSHNGSAVHNKNSSLAVHNTERVTANIKLQSSCFASEAVLMCLQLPAVL